MSIETNCPACGAPLPPNRTSRENSCPYCGAALPAVKTPVEQEQPALFEPYSPQDNAEAFKNDTFELPSAEMDDTMRVAADALNTVVGPQVRRWSRRIVALVIVGVLIALGSCACLILLVQRISTSGG